MAAFPIAVTSTGMVTGVGLNVQSSCAAIRCAIDNFRETGFVDSAGEPIRGCEVLFDQPWRGEARLLKMAAAAILECIEAQPDLQSTEFPLIFCAAEPERPGGVIRDHSQFLQRLAGESGMQFHRESRLIAGGHASIVSALRYARTLMEKQGIGRVLIASADSMLTAPALKHYEHDYRLLTSKNSNGFIPGEAGAALLLQPSATMQRDHLACAGLGTGTEAANIASEEPLRADGMCEAIRAALQEAQCTMGDLDFRLCDLAGEQYHFKEAALVLLRLLRQRKEEFDIWHPADCIGEVGAAIGLILVAILKTACEKGYTRGRNALAHLGNDDGSRGAMVLLWKGKGN
jgi:3-oxoacyl-[acyl-carrier-protein] synthase-1